MKAMRVLVCLFLLSLGLASRVPTSLISKNDFSLLEISTGLVECSQGFVCPIVDGVCCPQGNGCCSHRCVARGTSFQCADSEENEYEKKIAEKFYTQKLVDQQRRKMEKEEAEREEEEDRKEKRQAEENQFKLKMEMAAKKAEEEATAKTKALLAQLNELGQRINKNLTDLIPPEAKALLDAQAHKANATRNEMTPAQQVAQDHDSQTLIKPEAAWSNVAGFDSVRLETYRGLCLLSGVARGLAGTVLNLPFECRPDANLIFNAIKSGKPARVDITPDGKVLLTKNIEQEGLLSLSGITFPMKKGKMIQLSQGWSNHVNVPQTPQLRPSMYSAIGDMCIFSGVVEANIDPFSPQIFTLPDDCKPDARLIYSVNNDNHPVRIDATTNGTVVSPSGGFNSKILSLDGVLFTSNSKQQGRALTLSQGWVAVDQYRVPSYRRLGNLIILSGVAKPGLAGELARLPPGYIPSGRRVFFTNHHTSMAQVEVQADGTITCVSNKPDGAPGCSEWLTLDGVHFWTERMHNQETLDEENEIEVKQAAFEGRDARLLTALSAQQTQQAQPQQSGSADMANQVKLVQDQLVAAVKQ